MVAPLDSRQLRAFCSLARTGNFTQTARELQLTQSGISHSMKSLETDVGCRLLDRLGKKVVLTQAGEQLLEHAQKILQEMDFARTYLAQLGKRGHGRLRIGANTTACQFFLPGVLKEFKDTFPEHVLTLETGDTPELLSQLLQQKVDVAVGLEVEKESRLNFSHLFEDELFFIVHPQHSWVEKGAVVREEIPLQRHIHNSKNSVTFRSIEEYFQKEKITLRTVIQVGSVDAIKELGRRKLSRTWSAIHWRGKMLNLAEETFIRLCKTWCSKLALDHAAGSGQVDGHPQTA